MNGNTLTLIKNMMEKSQVNIITALKDESKK
jgi:hypothetical protein